MYLVISIKYVKKFHLYKLALYSKILKLKIVYNLRKIKISIVSKDTLE